MREIPVVITAMGNEGRGWDPPTAAPSPHSHRHKLSDAIAILLIAFSDPDVAVQDMGVYLDPADGQRRAHCVFTTKSAKGAFLYFNGCWLQRKCLGEDRDTGVWRKAGSEPRCGRTMHPLMARMALRSPGTAI